MSIAPIATAVTLAVSSPMVGLTHAPASVDSYNLKPVEQVENVAFLDPQNSDDTAGPDWLNKQPEVGEYSWRPQMMEGGGPPVSPRVGCPRARLGELTTRIAWEGLVCVPIGLATGPGGGFACGLISQRSLSYVPYYKVCG